jgi:hypothetical protein
MASYSQMLDAYLTAYQPDFKTELEQRGELQNWLDEQVETMRAAKARVLAQLQDRAPQLSPLQRDMEAERTVIEMFLTPP